MKRLYRRLSLSFLLAAALLLIFFAAGLYVRARMESGRYLNQLLENVENNIQQADGEYEDRIRHLKEDYITRAQAAAYILTETSEADAAAALDALREIMEVGEISLIDQSGEIFLSTDDSLPGSMADQELMEEMRTAPDGEKTAVRIDIPDFKSRPEYFYAVAEARPDWFGENPDLRWFEMVRIDADMSDLNLLSGKELVGNILRQATTEKRTGIFAVSKTNGKIFGITENNSQEIRLEDADEGQELLAYLSDIPEGKNVIRIVNGEYRAMVLKSTSDMYLAAYTGLDQLLGDMVLSFLIGLTVIGLISILTVMIVRHYLQKYMFQYFERIRGDIHLVLSGEGRAEGSSDEIPELKPLFETIIRLEEGYTEKTRGINSMENLLARARTEAEYDRLTGLYNRNGFERRVKQSLEQGIPSGMLILFDLDNFKKINDSEGHPEGDRALRIFADCLTRGFRGGDVTGRLGGDEFVVFIPNPVPRDIVEDKFRTLLNEVRKNMQDYHEKYGVSVSIGAVPVERNDRNYEKLYRCADTALYIAKYLGKNQFYINDKKIDCMRRECIRCRADCPRSRILSSAGEPCR